MKKRKLPFLSNVFKKNTEEFERKIGRKVINEWSQYAAEIHCQIEESPDDEVFLRSYLSESSRNRFTRERLDYYLNKKTVYTQIWNLLKPYVNSVVANELKIILLVQCDRDVVADELKMVLKGLQDWQKNPEEKTHETALKKFLFLVKEHFNDQARGFFLGG